MASSDVAIATPPVIPQVAPVVVPPVAITRASKIAGSLLAAGVIIVITLLYMRGVDTTDSSTQTVADVAPAPAPVAQKAVANVSTQQIVAPAANQAANAAPTTQSTEVISLPLVTIAQAPAVEAVSVTATDGAAAVPATAELITRTVTAAATRQDAPAAIAAAAQALVTAWTNAWQNQEVAAYLAFYHADFVPPNQASRASWEKRRNETISSQSRIAITVEDFREVNNSGYQTTVQFRLTYRGDSYADRTVKQLVLQPDASGTLRILQETNLQTEVFDPVIEDAARWMPDANTAATIAATTITATTETAEPAASQLAPDDAILVAASLEEAAASSKQDFAEGPAVDLDVTETIPLIFNLTSLTSAEVGQINNFLLQWAHAWQSQDADRYFAHYHPDYKTPELASAAAWREERLAKIAAPAHLSISLNELEILETNDSNILIELLMEYHADSYADRTLKRMLLTRTAAGRWLITMETNLEVEKL
jgi:ketosteroid isomerase-like protein